VVEGHAVVDRHTVGGGLAVVQVSREAEADLHLFSADWWQGPQLRAMVRSPGWHFDRKRTIDVVCSLLLLLVLLPLMLVIACAIKLESPGPVFYRVSRVSHGGRRFQMLKFRKMHVLAVGGPLTMLRDPRLTRVGAFLTATRLDELPQLWHVLSGQMSLVGPRPEDPGFVALHLPAYADILKVRPGITGITQLAFARESEILDQHDPVGDYVNRILPLKLHLDRLYSTDGSLWMDLKVILWTLRAVVTGCEVAVHRQTAQLTRRLPRYEAVPATAALAAEQV
jgi:lipopolysaccharide/colanic/teichoic acid biosynthesis glycosyltransferase